MSNKNQPRSQRRGAAPGAPRAQTGDSFQNLAARTGMGAGSVADDSHYSFTPISRNRVQLEWCYRSSWIAGKAVDDYAEDMTREGINLLGQVDPDDAEEIEREATRLQIWAQLAQVIKWARLYGGCIGFLMIEGQKPETPLRLDTIEKGQFKGILVLDRWLVQPTLTDVVQELGPEFGQPKFYEVVAKAENLPSMKIHHSRCIRFDGVDLPYWQKVAENGWGQSVLERLWDRLIAFDSTTAGSAQLVYKAHLRTYKVEGLRDIIAVGGKAFEGLVAQINMIRQYQSNEGMTLMDAKDEFEAHNFTFSGLSDMMLQFGQQISGAIGIPLVRLFGQSPAGLNSTGESDLRTYYDNIKQQQEAKLLPGVQKVYGLLYRSVIGSEPPSGFGIEFCPLWLLSNKEKAEIAESIGRSVSQQVGDGTIDRATALKELRQSSKITGIYTNISDDDIKEAEEEPPPMPGELPGQEQQGPGNEKQDDRPQEAEGAGADRSG